jgi:hypothetical protein
LILASGNLSAQLVKNGSLTGYVYSIISDMPGRDGNDYQDPSSAQFSSWKELIHTLLNKDFSTAFSLAASFSYDLIEWNDGSEKYYILQKKEGSLNYWGSYVFNPNACRNIVIQSPHPKYDLNTGKQGVYVLKHTGAFFYCLAGTHRCNSSSTSTCSGSTTACGSTSGPYRISDMAHNDKSIFQATTEAVKESDSTLVFIQLHGFGKTSNDPYVIMSNGTRITPGPDYINLLKNELSAVDNVLTFKIAHLNLSWNRLIAFTNVQGRYLNSGIDICGSNADTTFGTFIHIEQEKSRLRADSTKWDKMVQAINGTFSCEVSGVTGARTDNSYNIYPNPAQNSVTLEFLNPGQEEIFLSFYDISGRLVYRTSVKTDRIEINTGNMMPGLYFFRLSTEISKPFTGKLIIE